MKIAIISGKGGTGKTFVATSLALFYSESENTSYLDCDVEEPNGHIFLGAADGVTTPVTKKIPAVDKSLCVHCGACARVCQFGAILSFKTKTHILNDLCHACGACTLACPHNAVKETDVSVGNIRKTVINSKLIYTMGLLDIGEMSGVRLIRALKKKAPQAGMVILDAPPGASCSVVETVKGADMVILVTEPTPMGLHDLRLACEITAVTGKPYGIVINRYENPYAELESFAGTCQASFVHMLPFEREAAQAYAEGKPGINISPLWRTRFKALADKISGALS